MKKSINIGFLLFLLFQACASEENSNTQSVVEPIAEDTPINEPENNNPPPPENNSDSSTSEYDDTNKTPQEEKPVGNRELIDEALKILENPADDVIRCIDNDVYGLYDQVKEGYQPDDYEAQVVINCFNNPEYYGPIDGTSSSPPPEDGNNNPPPVSDEGAYEDYDNFYSYFGSPSVPEQREYLTYQYLGSTSQENISETEAIFFGQTLPTDEKKFDEALYKSGWLQKTCPYDAANLGEVCLLYTSPSPRDH